MIWRNVTEQDLQRCLAIDETRLGQALIGTGRATQAWKTLLRDPSCVSGVIEGEVRGVKRIVSFCASAFVSPAFAERELARPTAGVNARILQSIDSGRSVLLTGAERRAGNTRGDLTIIVLAASWIDGLSADQQREVQLLQAGCFLEAHKGYQIKQIVYEVTSAKDRAYAEAIPGWVIVADFGDCRHAGLAVMEREKARSIPGSIGALLFGFPKPVLGLRAPEQEILGTALRGLTDEEAALQLNLSPAAIKKRWAAMFVRVSGVKPELIQDDGCNGARGRQKRHRLMAYLREHPEELRPIEPRPRMPRRTLKAIR